MFWGADERVHSVSEPLQRYWSVSDRLDSLVLELQRPFVAAFTPALFPQLTEMEIDVSCESKLVAGRLLNLDEGWLLIGRLRDVRCNRRRGHGLRPPGRVRCGLSSNPRLPRQGAGSKPELMAPAAGNFAATLSFLLAPVLQQRREAVETVHELAVRQRHEQR